MKRNLNSLEKSTPVGEIVPLPGTSPQPCPQNMQNDDTAQLREDGVPPAHRNRV